MAEYAVSTAVTWLTTRLIEEPLLLKGVSEKVELLRDKLRWMQGFLEDADAVQERSERFRIFVSQIRDVTFDAEVAIETYISKAAARSWIKVLKKPIYRRRVLTEIEKIQARVEEISKDKEFFGTASMNNQQGGEAMSSNNERLGWWRHPSPNMQEDDLIDLVEDTKALITQLSAMERSRSVVSIVGMGGLGKTTLAKKLYNHPDLGNRFHCRSFVYVSQEFNRREILQKIIKDVACPHEKDELGKLEEEKMVDMLHIFLKDRRYLVVLDDIWIKEVWDGLQAAFPRGEMGSKVMVTTRFRDVAKYADPGSTPHEPRLLTEDESLELFLKKALPGADVNDISSDLLNLGRKMVAKCGGLPLAVIVLGGLLSTKSQTTVEWERVLQNISWYLLSAQDRVSAILALSYNDLPFHLKSCFLHLGIFPEDSSIEKMHLIRLWVAEGFLPQQGAQIEEDVAENCLNQLIDRCMIQVGTLTYLGSVKTVCIHDVLRDFCLTKGREENFLGIYTGQEQELSACHHPTKSRRLAIHTPRYGYVNLKPYTHLRSLQYLSDVTGTEFTGETVNSLRVLEQFSKSPGFNFDSRLNNIVGDLIQLRFLGLAKGRYPSSLSSLKNLQTLDMRFGFFPIKELKIENLRHLLLPEHNSAELTLGTMIHLQTLKDIKGGRWIEDGLAKMINLRRLKIRSLSRDGVTLVISIVETLRHLQSLTLIKKGFDHELFPPLEGLSRCDHLQKLRLCGEIEKLPDASGFPRNLVKLVLMGSYLPKDSVVILERLPNLKMLALGNQSCLFDELVCSSEGFLQLQVLHLIQEDLEVWKVEEGALKKLRQLTIYECSKLKVPEGLKSLTTLQELDIQKSPEFEHMLRTNEDLIEFTRKYSIKFVHRYKADILKWSTIM